MKTNSKQIQCIDTGEIFTSCRQADDKYGWPKGTAWHIANMHGNPKSAKAQIFGHDFKFIDSSDANDNAVYDRELIEWMLTPPTSGYFVKCIETDQVFQSCKSADIAFGFPINTVSRIMSGKVSRNDYHFVKAEFSDVIPEGMPSQDSEEIFKVIPEFPKYSISNFGRVKHNRTGNIKCPVKRSCRNEFHCSVVIQKETTPTTANIRSLYRSAWLNIPIHANPQSGLTLSKKITCITYSESFSSYMKCAEHYKVDYQKLREAIHSAHGNEFKFANLLFKVG